MGYSEAAEAGKKIHGKRWRSKIYGVGDAIARVRKALEEDDPIDADVGLRLIAKAFAPAIEARGEDVSYSVREDLEWFQEEEAGSFCGVGGGYSDFIAEFDYRLGSLYDFADFYRIWVDPTTTPPQTNSA